MFQTGLNKDFAKPALKHKHYDNKKKKKTLSRKNHKKIKIFFIYVSNCNKLTFFCAKNLNLLASVRLSKICKI